MSEMHNRNDGRPATPPESRLARSTRPWLLLALLLAAAAYGGWRVWIWAGTAYEGQQQLLARLEQDLKTLRAQTDALSGLPERQQRSEAELARLGEAVQGLSETVETGRARLQLAAVEQLLLAANDRLLLARDIAAARQALELADRRLALLNDPRLLPVREALAQERAALAALPAADTAGAALALAEILRRAPQLPLHVRVPERFEAEAEPVALPPDAAWYQRAWIALETALADIFTLRRHEGAAPRLLPPGQEALVAQTLQLKLEGARLAVLAGDGAAFQDLVQGARNWLRQYYDETDPGVSAALAQLDRLGGLDWSQPLPDIGRSLALLRRQLGFVAQ